MSHKLREDVRIFAVGYVFDHPELEALARKALEADFIAIHFGDPVQAFKWRATKNEFEVFDKRDKFFVAVHFYPWVLGTPAPRELEKIPAERYQQWYDLYGHHLPHRCKAQRMLYPLASLGAVSFLPRYLQKVVDAYPELGGFLVPAKPSESPATTSLPIALPLAVQT